MSWTVIAVAFCENGAHKVTAKERKRRWILNLQRRNALRASLLVAVRERHLLDLVLVRRHVRVIGALGDFGFGVLALLLELFLDRFLRRLLDIGLRLIRQVVRRRVLLELD